MTTTLHAGWMPIESAPKDGTPVLLFARHVDATASTRVVGSFDNNGFGWIAQCYVGQPFARLVPSHWMELPPFPGTHPASAQPARDWELDCDHCNGSGHVFVKHQVAERESDVQEFKEDCECCEGRGFVFAFQDIPGIEEYVRKSRPVASAQDTKPDDTAVICPGCAHQFCAIPVQIQALLTRAGYKPPFLDASAQDDAKDERSDTYGTTLGERIAHVGGRTNAQGYIEFGSPMAVNALIQHVLRDIECTRQDDDGAYQARYRLPGGQWSSWGHVVCGVKGHEQELRFLPDGRRPAPAAGDAQDAAQQGKGGE